MCPQPRIEWWNFGVGALLGLFTLLFSHGVYAAFFGMSVRIGSPDMAVFLPALLLGVFFVFMQTTFEELVFRGYGMQAVRRFTVNPVALVLGTGVLFAVVHFENVRTIGWPWWGMLYYLLIALPLAYMVLRTGSLWMPMGFHWLFNLITTRIYSQESDIASGRDLLAYQVGRPSLEVELAIQAVTFLTVALIVNYLVSRREAAQVGGEAEAAS